MTNYLTVPNLKLFSQVKHNLRTNHTKVLKKGNLVCKLATGVHE